MFHPSSYSRSTTHQRKRLVKCSITIKLVISFPPILSLRLDPMRNQLKERTDMRRSNNKGFFRPWKKGRRFPIVKRRRNIRDIGAVFQEFVVFVANSKKWRERRGDSLASHEKPILIQIERNGNLFAAKLLFFARKNQIYFAATKWRCFSSQAESFSRMSEHGRVFPDEPEEERGTLLNRLSLMRRAYETQFILCHLHRSASQT